MAGTYNDYVADKQALQMKQNKDRLAAQQAAQQQAQQNLIQQFVGLNVEQQRPLRETRPRVPDTSYRVRDNMGEDNYFKKHPYEGTKSKKKKKKKGDPDYTDPTVTYPTETEVANQAKRAAMSAKFGNKDYSETKAPLWETADNPLKDYKQADIGVSNPNKDYKQANPWSQSKDKSNKSKVDGTTEPKSSNWKGKGDPRNARQNEVFDQEAMWGGNTLEQTAKKAVVEDEGAFKPSPMTGDFMEREGYSEEMMGGKVDPNKEAAEYAKGVADYATSQADEASPIKVNPIIENAIDTKQFVDDLETSIAAGMEEAKAREAEAANAQIAKLNGAGLSPNGIRKYLTADGREMTPAESDALDELEKVDAEKNAKNNPNAVSSKQVQAVTDDNIIKTLPNNKSINEKKEKAGVLSESLTAKEIAAKSSKEIWSRFETPKPWYESDAFQSALITYAMNLGSGQGAAYNAALEQFRNDRGREKRMLMIEDLKEDGYTDAMISEWVETNDASVLVAPDTKQYMNTYRTKDGRITNTAEEGATLIGQAGYEMNRDGTMRQVTTVDTGIIPKPKDPKATYRPVYGTDQNGRYITTPPTPNSIPVGQLNMLTNKLETSGFGDGKGGKGGSGGGAFTNNPQIQLAARTMPTFNANWNQAYGHDQANYPIQGGWSRFRSVFDEDGFTGKAIMALPVSDAEKQAINNERMWLQAYGRPLSGGAITAGEWSTWSSGLFPRPEDYGHENTSQILLQKQMARDMVAQAVTGMVASGDLDPNTTSSEQESRIMGQALSMAQNVAQNVQDYDPSTGFYAMKDGTLWHPSMPDKFITKEEAGL